MDIKDKELAIKMIVEAKKHIEEDPHLSNFMLRDLKATKEAGLDELSWSMHREGCVKEDVEYLIYGLENCLNNQDLTKGDKE